MQEDKIINKFEVAIRNNELLDFALGLEKYFVLDTEYDEHFVYESYTMYIIPLMREKSEKYVKPFLYKMIMEILKSSILPDPKKYQLAWYHLNVYYYLRSEGRIKGNAFQKVNNIEREFYNFMNFLSTSNLPALKILLDSIKVIQSRGGIQNLMLDGYLPLVKNI